MFHFKDITLAKVWATNASKLEGRRSKLVKLLPCQLLAMLTTKLKNYRQAFPFLLKLHIRCVSLNWPAVAGGKTYLF